MSRPRFALVVATVALASGCRRDRAGVVVPASAEPVTVAAVDASVPAPAPAPKSPFSVVSLDARIAPTKLANGAVVGLVFGAERSYAATLAPNGDVVPLRAFARKALPGELVGISGTWPGELFVDFMFEGEWRTRGYQRFAWVVTEKGVRDASRTDARFSPAPWSNDRVLALTAPWVSALGPELHDATFRLAVVGGAGKGPPLPKLPAKALNTSSPGDALVGYPSGLVLVTGWDGIAKKDPGMPARTGRPKVWVLADGAWSVREPSVDADSPLGLVAGADETQTLLVGKADDGKPLLARWTGTDFVPVAGAPRLSAVSVGTDGTVWGVAVSDDERNAAGVLRRASFPELRFEDVPLPKIPTCPKLVVDGVVARSASDVWVTASCSGSEASPLLHTSPRAAPIALPTRAELVAK